MDQGPSLDTKKAPQETNKDDKDDDSSVDSLDATLGTVLSTHSPAVHGETCAKNHGLVGYKRLSGDLLLFYASTGYTYQFFLHVVVAVRNHYPVFRRFPCAGVQLSTARNSNDDPVKNDAGFPCHGLVVFKRKSTPQLEISTFLAELVDFCNHNTFTKADGLRHNHNWITYQPFKVPDQTDLKKEKAKLGDVVRQSDAIDFLQSLGGDIFSSRVYHTHRGRIQKYFNPPYSADLCEHFGFPSNSTEDVPPMPKFHSF